MTQSKLVAPVVKWVGGKRQLLPQIIPFFPKRISSYCEPFIGGGAVFFYLQPKQAIINDLNHDLILVYETIRDNLDELLENLKLHQNDKDYYYTLRNIDRDVDKFKTLSKVERASRLLYLNKTCFNGLYRVNSSGEFNSPFGNYKNPKIVNEKTLTAVSNYLKSNNIKFFNEDFAKTLNRIESGGFVYLDPPYDPVSQTANFTGYNQSGFNRQEQIRLKEACDQLNERNIKFMLSNSATDFIIDLYKDYNIKTVTARRAVNVNGQKRGEVAEVIIRNYTTRQRKIVV